MAPNHRTAISIVGVAILLSAIGVGSRVNFWSEQSAALQCPLAADDVSGWFVIEPFARSAIEHHGPIVIELNAATEFSVKDVHIQIDNRAPRKTTFHLSEPQERYEGLVTQFLTLDTPLPSNDEESHSLHATVTISDCTENAVGDVQIESTFKLFKNYQGYI